MGERSTPGLASYRLPKITHWPCKSIISTANIKIMGEILKLVQWSARPEEQVKKKFWLGRQQASSQQPVAGQIPFFGRDSVLRAGACG